MLIKQVCTDGKRRIIIRRSTSGVDKIKDAILAVMGPSYTFDDDNIKKRKEGKNSEDSRERGERS